MSQTRIPIVEPIRGPEGPIEVLIYRQPRWNDIMPVGSPFTVHRTPDGNRFIVENNEAIAHYAQACLVHPKEPHLLEQLGVTDTLAVREAILDFFTPGLPESPASSTSSPTSSSGDAASLPTTSEA